MPPNLQSRELKIDKTKNVTVFYYLPASPLTRGPWAKSLTCEYHNNTFAQRYDYTITLIKTERTNYLFSEKWTFFICLKLNPMYSKMLCVQFVWFVWLQLAQWFQRRRLLNFVNKFSLFRYYLPKEKGLAFNWKNPTWNYFTQGYFELSNQVKRKSI